MTKRARINSKDKVAEEIVKTICILPVLAEPIMAGTDGEVQRLAHEEARVYRVAGGEKD